MKKLLSIIAIAFLFSSCSPQYQWVIGNPRIKHQNEMKRIKKEQEKSTITVKN